MKDITSRIFVAASFLSIGFQTTAASMAQPADITIKGDMQVKISAAFDDGRTITGTFNVPPLQLIQVDSEKHGYFPAYDTSRTWYLTGTSPMASTFNAITEIVVKAGSQADAKTYIEGKDYVFSREWNRIGQTKDSTIKPPVWISYKMIPQRIDSIVLKDGKLHYRSGIPKGLMPRQPQLVTGETRLANIYLPGACQKLTEENLYPITMTEFPRTQPVADTLLPKTMDKLRNGKKLKILAWGDSITEGYGKLDKADRWQEQLVRRLKARFPQADIELVTNAWGGHNTGHFLAAPETSPKNYEKKILGESPNLIISEFHNDLWMTNPAFTARYDKLRQDFNGIGAEWIIITPNWNASSQNRIKSVPEHITLLRQYAATHRIALADAAARWGTLWQQGIPYLTLMVNQFNHPDRDGMSLYTDALMDLFPAR